MSLVKERYDCPIPCSINAIEAYANSVHFVRGTPTVPEEVTAQQHVYFNFPTNIEVLHKQYFVDDYGTVAAAVGGGMGLTLGLSIMGAALAAWEVIFEKKKKIGGEQNRTN